jgi:hypothetical protein
MANEGKIKCTFDGCYEYFPGELMMRKHKKHIHENEYCHICDIDFEEWETMIAHKSSMSGMDVFRKTQSQYRKEREDGSFGFLKEKKFGPDYGKLKFHMYYCKFCGMKYQTAAARDDHTLRVSLCYSVPQQNLSYAKSQSITRSDTPNRSRCQVPRL